MNCPVCGSEITAGTRYCPVCGTDVEGALMRGQQAGAPTQQMPAYQQAAPRQQAPAPQMRAVPMNSSMPPQSTGRDFDTSKMGSSPKWPIVLIAVLVIIIAVVLLLLFKPWEGITGQPGVQEPNSSTPVATVDQPSGAAPVSQPGEVSENTQGQAAPVSQGLSNQEAYGQLSASYEQLDGIHQQISAVAADFSNQIGVGDMTEVRNRAADVQAQVASAVAALNAINLAADSPYAATKAAIAELYNDLAMRIGVLVEACDADLAGQDYGAILSRDNGSPDEHGHTNVYLIHYEQNYDAARPAAPQA